MKIEYATRPSDNYDTDKYPDATDVVKVWNRRVISVMGVFQTYAVAEQVVANLNNHAEFQIR